MFAKLYGPEDDQVLVLLQSGDEGPEVRVFFEPEGLGVCSAAIGWKDDSDKSWDLAEKTLSEMTEERAREFVDRVYASMGLER